MALEKLGHIPFSHESIKIERAVLQDEDPGTPGVGSMAEDTWTTSGYKQQVQEYYESQAAGRSYNDRVPSADRLARGALGMRSQELVIGEKGQLVRLSWLPTKSSRILADVQHLENYVLSPSLLEQLTDAQLDKLMPEISEHFNIEIAELASFFQNPDNQVLRGSLDVAGIQDIINRKEPGFLGELYGKIYQLDNLDSAGLTETFEWAVLHYDYLRYGLDLATDKYDGIANIDPTGNAYDSDLESTLEDSLGLTANQPNWYSELVAKVAAGQTLTAGDVETARHEVMSDPYKAALTYVRTSSASAHIEEMDPSLWDNPQDVAEYFTYILERLQMLGGELPVNNNAEGGPAPITRMTAKGRKLYDQNGNFIMMVVQGQSEPVKAKLRYRNNYDPNSNIQLINQELIRLAAEVGLKINGHAPVVATSLTTTTRLIRDNAALIEVLNRRLPDIDPQFTYFADGAALAKTLTKIQAGADNLALDQDGEPLMLAESGAQATIEQVADAMYAHIIANSGALKELLEKVETDLLAALVTIDTQPLVTPHDNDIVTVPSGSTAIADAEVRDKVQYAYDNNVAVVTFVGLADTTGNTSNNVTLANTRYTKTKAAFERIWATLTPAKPMPTLKKKIDAMAPAGQRGARFEYEGNTQAAKLKKAEVKELVTGDFFSYLEACIAAEGKTSGPAVREVKTTAQAVVDKLITIAGGTNVLAVDVGVQLAEILRDKGYDGTTKNGVLLGKLKDTINGITADPAIPEVDWATTPWEYDASAAGATDPGTSSGVSTGTITVGQKYFEVNHGTARISIPVTAGDASAITSLQVDWGKGANNPTVPCSFSGGNLVVNLSLWQGTNTAHSQVLLIGDQRVTVKFKAKAER